MTDEELVQRVNGEWAAFRRIELYRGDPAREASLKDELINYLPILAHAIERLRAENAAMREIVRQVAHGWPFPTPPRILAEQARVLVAQWDTPAE